LPTNFYAKTVVSLEAFFKLWTDNILKQKLSGVLVG